MGKWLLYGEVSLEFLFEVNNILTTRSMMVPFNFEMVSEGVEDDSSIETEFEVVRDNFTIIGDGMIEVDIGIEFNLGFSKDRDLNLIQEISVEDRKDDTSYSMVIYFVKRGDTLWRIAKSFRSTMEDIRRVNDLDENDRILAGQQLFIPKYMRRQIA